MLDLRLNNETCNNGSLLRVDCGSMSSVCVVLTDQTQFMTAIFPLNNGTRPAEGTSSYNILLGLGLALLSATFIGVSVIMKKKALLRLPNDGSTRAGDGGHGYLKDWLWWGGLLTMGAGEVLNFVAYGFAPVTLVTPLGALAVIVSAVLSSVLLGEALNIIGKLGCFLCIIGSVLLVIHAPQEKEVTSLQELTVKLLEPGFLVYALLVFLASFVLIVIFAPRFGQTHILVYISICSLLGAFTVASAKGLILVLQTCWFDSTVLTNPLTYILLLTLILSILAQVNYLNKSLDIFNTQMVYPIYYVFFTSVVLCTSIILFQEWRSMSPIDVTTTLGSFMVIVVGVALLNLFRDRALSNKMERPLDPLPPEPPTSPTTTAPTATATGKGRSSEEDKYGLIENMVIESLPPMGEEGPRVFIIS